MIYLLLLLFLLLFLINVSEFEAVLRGMNFAIKCGVVNKFHIVTDSATVKSWIAQYLILTADRKVQNHGIAEMNARRKIIVYYS